MKAPLPIILCRLGLATVLVLHCQLRSDLVMINCVVAGSTRAQMVTNSMEAGPTNSLDGWSEFGANVGANEEDGSATNGEIQAANKQEEIQLKKQTIERKLQELKQKYGGKQAVSDRAYYILLLVYSSFILVGTLSNSLICLTVILRPRILSARNLFIVNLAGSDLLLCVFTMPFSFMEITMKVWQMGLIPCKLVSGLQATSIFVSTMSITAIALDRYKVIVYPTRREEAAGTTRQAGLLLASVWLFALLLSVPLFWVRAITNHPVLGREEFCVEAWPFPHGRGFYSAASMCVQYLVPITVVSFVYAKISDRLKRRLRIRQRATQLECQQKRQLNLIKRTHTMLISVSLVFGLSWLPLNLLNVIADFSGLFPADSQFFRLLFALCHLIGCSSACTNPILYAYLNENFRKESQQVYRHYFGQLMARFERCCSCFGVSMVSNGERQNNSVYRQTANTNINIAHRGDHQKPDNGADDIVDQTTLAGARLGGQSSFQATTRVANPPPASQTGANGASPSAQSPIKTLSASAYRTELLGSNLFQASSTNNTDRRQSFQTVATTSSRATTIGKTMRFCLCLGNNLKTPISSSNSSLDTSYFSHNHDGHARTSFNTSMIRRQQSKAHGSKCSQQHQQQQQHHQAGCQCVCHKASGSMPANLNQLAWSRGGKGAISSTNKNGSNNKASSLSSFGQVSSHHRLRRTTMELADVSGRRVWLRFFAPTSDQTAVDLAQQLAEPGSAEFGPRQLESLVVAERLCSLTKKQTTTTTGERSPSTCKCLCSSGGDLWPTARPKSGDTNASPDASSPPGAGSTLMEPTGPNKSSQVACYLSVVDTNSRRRRSVEFSERRSTSVIVLNLDEHERSPSSHKLASVSISTSDSSSNSSSYLYSSNSVSGSASQSRSDSGSSSTGSRTGSCTCSSLSATCLNKLGDCARASCSGSGLGALSTPSGEPCPVGAENAGEPPSRRPQRSTECDSSVSGRQSSSAS